MNTWNIDKSLALQNKAAKLIPGMTQLLSKRPDMYSRGVWPTYFKKAKGSRVVDLDGNEYIECSICGIGTTVLGYCDDDVNQAVIDVKIIIAKTEETVITSDHIKAVKNPVLVTPSI